MSTSERNLCPECGNNIFITDNSRGQTICDKCGVVIQKNCIDPRAEWRAFTPEEQKRKTRVGPKTSLSMFDKGLTTIIGKENKDASGVRISPTKRSEFHRLRKWQERTKFRKSIDRNLSYALNILDRMCSQFYLTDEIRESTAYYYRKIIQKSLLRGRSIEEMITASLYVVLKMKNRNAVIQLIKKNSNLNSKNINRNVKIIQREFNLKFTPTKPQDLIPLYISELSLSWQTGTKAINILSILERKTNFSGKSPRGLAASALYCACIIKNERRSQYAISTVAGITELTLRKNYKMIRDKLNLKFN